MTDISTLLPENWKEIAACIDAYEARQKDGVDDLREFVAHLEGDQRRAALEELIKVDLEFRWKAGKGKTLEEYAADYPELGLLASPNTDLLVAESQARRIAADTALESSRSRQFARYREQFADEKTKELEVPFLDSTAKQTSDEATSPDEVQVGARFDRYDILKHLGKGGMGSVFLAYDPKLDRKVALKVMPRYLRSDARLSSRFQREAKAAATIHHPNACPIFDFGKVGDTHYFTMAFIDGSSLKDVLEKSGKLSPPEAVSIVQKVAQAIHAFHSAGVIHRDLKPGNIMMNRAGEPILVDFGLARLESSIIEDLTRSGQLMGTPSHMAPEQIEGDSQRIGPATDVFAAGVVLYQLLTGKLPFKGHLYSALIDDPTPPSQYEQKLDPGLGAVCLKALAKQPEERYASAAEFAEALLPYVAGTRSSAEASTRSHIPDSFAGPSNPATEQPAMEQPVMEQPVMEQPVMEQPVVGQPVVGQPVVGQLATEQRTTEQRTTEQRTTEQRTTEQRTTQGALASRWSSRGLAILLTTFVLVTVMLTAQYQKIPPSESPQEPIHATMAGAREVGFESGENFGMSRVRPELELHFQRLGERQGFDIAKDEPLSLFVGDKIQIHGRLTGKAYAYLYWYDDAGRGVRFWPREEDLDNQRLVSVVQEPFNTPGEEPQKWWRVKGSGVDVILLAVSRLPLPAEKVRQFDRMVATLDPRAKQQVLDGQSLESLSLQRKTRAPDVIVLSRKGSPSAFSGPFRTALDSMFDAWDALAFPLREAQ